MRLTFDPHVDNKLFLLKKNVLLHLWNPNKKFISFKEQLFFFKIIPNNFNLNLNVNNIIMTTNSNTKRSHSLHSVHLNEC